ncbi:MAG TPA: signal peptidase I [Rhizomicrobium sp.]|nr:signal peptidase I [Rhizomicrobium sp.]
MDDVNENAEYEATDPAAGAPAAVTAAAMPDVDGGTQPAAVEPETTAVPSPLPVEPVVVQPAKPAEGESWVETVKTVVYALLIALVVRTFFFQPFNIPSGSMEATLLVGDYLFVEKFAYGYSRNSFPFSAPPFSGRIFGSAPTRGDVVVFKMPNKDSADYMKDYIKRVIGLPGDRIQMIDSRLYINDKIVPRVPVQDYVETVDGVEHHVPQFRETLPNGKSYLTLDRERYNPLDNTGVYVVPPGHYFMMGDNRDNSDDSRANVGYVPAENLVGKAEFIFFSIDLGEDWWAIWKWPTEIRYSRILTGID